MISLFCVLIISSKTLPYTAILTFKLFRQILSTSYNVNSLFFFKITFELSEDSIKLSWEFFL